MNCTWEDCQNKATFVQKANNGEVWARLCEEHANKMDEAIDALMNGDPKPVLSCWLKAKGGKTALADKILKNV